MTCKKSRMALFLVQIYIYVSMYRNSMFEKIKMSSPKIYIRTYIRVKIILMLQKVEGFYEANKYKH